MDIQQSINQILSSQNLSRAEMQEVMRLVMTGQATDAQIGGFLIGLRMKGETVEEIAGAASIMRELATPVQVDVDHLVDTCGTGGDGSSIFNVSTASAFVAAAAGAHVAKHGNRSVSSKSGSADVLEAAGVNLDLSAIQVAKCIEHVGLGFMFAPAHHSAMKHAIGPRRELAVRTIFNLLGPLTNPAGAPNQVLGVFSRDWVEPLAEVLRELGSKHVMVVHSEEGLDELSPVRATYVAELKNGEIESYQVDPKALGLQAESIEGLQAQNVEESLELVRKGISDLHHPAADIVALNAGAAIYVAGIASSLKEGLAMAQDAIGSGLAKNKLNELVDFSRTLKAIEAEES